MLRALALLCALWLAAAPGGARREPATALEPIPRPNLERVEEAVRQQLEETRATVDELLAAADAPAGLTAEAVGRLGQLYFLYGLTEASRAAFRTASRLSPADFRWLYYLGILAEQEGDAEAAEKAYRAVLERRPEDLPTLLRLGLAAVAGNRLEEAAAWFERALEIAPATAAAQHGLGQVAFLGGDYAAAVTRFEAALAAQPEASVVHYQLGLAYRELGDLDRAREHLSRHGRDPVGFADPLTDGLAALTAGAGIHIVRGTRAFSAGRYELAVDAYRQAVAADPDNLTARQSLASALAYLGQLDAALGEYAEVLRRQPDDALALYNVGTLHLKRGEDEEALAHLRRAVDLAPDLADAQYNLAAVLDRLGRLEAAAEAAGRAVDLDPQDAGARLLHANLTGRLGRYREAEDELRRLLREDPQNGDAMMSLGTLLARTDRGDEAVEVWGAVLALDLPTDVRAGAALAVAGQLERAGRTEEALASYRQAAALAPAAVDVQLTVAAALGRGGRLTDAADAFTAALTLDRSNEQAWFGRATALMLAGSDRGARTALEEGLAELPASIPLGHALARLLAASSDDAVRDGQRALELARSVLDRQPALAHAETLAMALAEVGRFREAAEWQRRILREARAAGQGGGVARLERHLALYEAGRPVRAPWKSSSG